MQAKTGQLVSGMGAVYRPVERIKLGDSVFSRAALTKKPPCGWLQILRLRYLSWTLGQRLDRDQRGRALPGRPGNYAGAQEEAKKKPHAADVEG
jgi:hypothetical protein